jgi:tRNA pseudouridine55 synthase
LPSPAHSCHLPWAINPQSSYNFKKFQFEIFVSNNPLDGWLNILKPPGMSSHDVVAWTRRLLGGKEAPKIGHTGTLDPAASGVLPLGLGRATRLARFIEDRDKTYIFEMVFGRETDSLDAEGRVINETALLPTESELQSVLPKFIGNLSQIPPAFSAIQVQGVRAYKLARKAAQLDLPPREIHIQSLQLLNFRSDDTTTALLQVVCSKGTYIRSLCADLAKALGTLAHVGFLSRQQVGPFALENSLTLEELQEGDLSKALLAPDWPLDHLSPLWLTEEQGAGFVQGRTQEIAAAGQGEYYRVYLADRGLFLGLARLEGECLKPAIGLFSQTEFPAQIEGK